MISSRSPSIVVVGARVAAVAEWVPPPARDGSFYQYDAQNRAQSLHASGSLCTLAVRSVVRVFVSFMRPVIHVDEHGTDRRQDVVKVEQELVNE